MKKGLPILIFGILFLLFLNAFVSAYSWDFSTASDYSYNATEIIVTGGNAQLNGTNVPVYAWWHLNENNGTGVIDSSGNNRNGTTLSNPLWVTGKLNSSLQFNGISQYVDFGNSTGNFERTKSFSVELWFKTANTGQQIILSKMQPTGDYTGWEIYYDGTSTNKIYFDLSSIAITNHIRVFCSPSVVADNNWHHLIITYDGSSTATGVKFYFDGSPKVTGITYDTLTGSILTSTPFQLSGRGNGAMGIVGLLDEVVIYDGVLTSNKVTSRYNSGAGTENPVGDYPIGYYSIQPKTNFSFTNNLTSFTETATKTGSDIRYSVSSDNGINFKYWNGATWVASDGSWTQSNSASDVNTNIRALANSGNFSFKAILTSNDGTYTPYLDNIETQVCIESWSSAQYTACGTITNASCYGTWDNKTKYYIDLNSCGTFNNLPSDNGTCVACNYCDSSWTAHQTNCTVFDTDTKYYTESSGCCNTTPLPSDCTPPIDNGTTTSCDYCVPNWICGQFDLPCPNPLSNDILKCLKANLTNSPDCCNKTNLTSDCIFSGNLSEYSRNCGYRYFFINMSFLVPLWDYIQPIVTVPTYPYVDWNVTYPIEVTLFLNGSKINIEWLKINITAPSGNISEFNFSWDADSKSYKEELIFTAIGDYNFTIYGKDPNQVIYNTTGMFLVREPFYVTFEGFLEKNTSKYINKWAYVILEIEKNPKMYNDALEQFITPLMFKYIYKKPVFHAPYIDGKATVKVYEKNQTYAVRMIDGLITFENVYSPPKVQKSYGVNMFVGSILMNGSNSTYQYYFTKKDLNQFTWLLNIIVFFGMLFAFVLAIALLIIIPDKPVIAMSFGLGITGMLILIKIMAWFISIS